MDRALPAAMVDLIRDGVPRRDLTARGDRAVWKALVSTAASASQRGLDCWEWETLVTEARSHLGTQARLKDGKRERSPKQLAGMLHKAWDTGTEWASRQPAARDWHADLTDAAKRLRDVMADPATPVDDAARAVLAFAATESLRLRSVTPTLPRRDLLAATGLGLTALRTLLARLSEGGVLVCVDRGQPSGPSARVKRGARYRLPDAEALASYLYRETRSVVPHAQVCGAPGSDDSGAPRQVCGAPSSEGPSMVTFTLSSTDPQALAAALRALAQEHDVRVEQVPDEPPASLPSNVRPLRPAR